MASLGQSLSAALVAESIGGYKYPSLWVHWVSFTRRPFAWDRDKLFPHFPTRSGKHPHSSVEEVLVLPCCSPW